MAFPKHPKLQRISSRYSSTTSVPCGRGKCTMKASIAELSTLQESNAIFFFWALCADELGSGSGSIGILDRGTAPRRWVQRLVRQVVLCPSQPTVQRIISLAASKLHALFATHLGTTTRRDRGRRKSYSCPHSLHPSYAFRSFHRRKCPQAGTVPGKMELEKSTTKLYSKMPRALIAGSSPLLSHADVRN